MIQDTAAEEALFGTIALADTVLPLLHQTGLRAEHFGRDSRKALYREILSTADRGEPVDTVTVPGLVPFLHGVPGLGNAETYARRVIDKARWRDRYTAGLRLMEAAPLEDETGVAEAERLLIAPADSDRVYRRARLRDQMDQHLSGTQVPGWAMPFFRQRLMPGTVWLWGAWTSHGKTVWVDQIARGLREQDATVWAWINEMTSHERMCRHASAETGIDLQDVMENRLTEDERERVAGSMDTIPFEVVECPGWSAEEIARDIRVRRPDVAIIDILHRIPYETERDLSRVSRVLGDAAKLAGCVVLATVHLNRNRIQTADRPQPTLADIKGASAFEQDADGVGMVWRQDDATSGKPTNDGMIYTLKVRMGKPHGTRVTLDGSKATFYDFADYEL